MANNVVMAFIARTTLFDKNVKKSGKQLTALQKRANFAKKAMVGFGSALAGIAAAKGLLNIVKRSAALIDSTAKLADRINITTEALAGLRHAAILSGESVATIDGGLQKMIRGIGQAAQGAGAARTALIGMGLDIEKLAKMSADKQFAAIADGINKMATQSDKAAAAADIFGRAGINMLNTLALGSKGLKSVSEEADNVGLALSRVDAKKVEDMNDSIARLEGVMLGIGNVITVHLAEPIKKSTDILVKWATAGEGVANKMRVAFTGVFEIFKRVRSILSVLPNMMNVLNAPLKAVTGLFSAATDVGVTEVINKTQIMEKRLEARKSNASERTAKGIETLISMQRRNMTAGGI